MHDCDNNGLTGYIAEHVSAYEDGFTGTEQARSMLQ
jgi:hypothetical protein